MSRPTAVLGEADGERAVGDLLLEQVLLVEEQDDGRLREPLVVADGVEQLHALVHPVLEAGEHVMQRLEPRTEQNPRAASGSVSSPVYNVVLHCRVAQGFHGVTVMMIKEAVKRSV